ncbi:hypothetical protein HNQ80_003811 [Anaerosolibacter carboniphilus]|uniref:DUF3221 domain-containing protein n=1 Tax=Anaerosolibacter carboniphilus TaxID=1417629 RepID=A0A841KZD9_9FIRM|nr:DUF3221 domain-containing protein [Anaerosolibacter carboniphilus]MBB6217688.1 hypothetical protein [Anaerosolibacter carboniphilus]
MKKLLFLFLAVSLVLGTLGCSKATNVSEKKIGIRGEIKKVVLDSNYKVESIYVEGKKEADTEYDKANIKITEDTIFLQHESMGHSSEDMMGKGSMVEVIFTGEVQESNPVQATAESIKAID